MLKTSFIMVKATALWSQLVCTINGFSLNLVSTVALITAVILAIAESGVVFTPLEEEEISQLEKYNIIPNYLSMPPDSRISITYPSGCIAKFGNLISEKRLQPIPKVHWDAQGEEYFTLIMINPDRQNKEPLPVDYLHWLVVNIKGNNVSTGQPIFKYEPPKVLEPFPRFHTYVFLLYYQVEGVVHIDRSYAATGKRGLFQVRNFTSQFLLDEPTAVNFFRIYDIWTNPDKVWSHGKKGYYDRWS